MSCFNNAKLCYLSTFTSELSVLILVCFLLQICSSAESSQPLMVSYHVVSHFLFNYKYIITTPTQALTWAGEGQTIITYDRSQEIGRKMNVYNASAFLNGPS